ncbi:MAG: hypothetical protein ACREUF_10525, partial [Solimonas sp.]
MLDVQADHLCAEVVVGACANGLSHHRKCEEAKQRSACGNRDERRLQARLVDQDAADLERLELVVHLHV